MLQSTNNLGFISVDSIYSNLGKKISSCTSLLAYHAFTGTDSTAIFSWKGKIQSMKKFEKDVQAQIAFQHLGELDDDQSNNFTKVENFYMQSEW